jgi:hypothetical protein
MSLHSGFTSTVKLVHPALNGLESCINHKFTEAHYMPLFRVLAAPTWILKLQKAKAN